jgi:hypothetical protein
MELGHAWAITAGIKFLVAIPVNPLVYQVLYLPNALWAPGRILFHSYVHSFSNPAGTLL